MTTKLHARRPRGYGRLAPGLFLLASLGLVACGEDEATIEAAFNSSAHANAESQAFKAFTLWGSENPSQIPTGCAKCHSTQGYLDFLGADGSEPGTVNQTAVAGAALGCEVCHNEVSEDGHSAVMPSGVDLVDLGANAACMDCHQGRASSVTVEEATNGLPDDVVNTNVRFISVHNNAAGPILYGALAKGGYHYDGESYLGRYDHALQINSCIACHDAHTMAIDPRKCAACHRGVTSAEDFASIRFTNIDFDGDGDVSSGLAAEIAVLKEDLLKAIQAYAARTKGLDRLAYAGYPPFFFNDADQPYQTWTPRLLRAAYNYHFAVEGAGSYVHNPKYMIQLLYDSLSDLGAKTRSLARP